MDCVNPRDGMQVKLENLLRINESTQSKESEPVTAALETLRKYFSSIVVSKLAGILGCGQKTYVIGLKTAT